MNTAKKKTMNEILTKTMNETRKKTRVIIALYMFLCSCSLNAQSISANKQFPNTNINKEALNVYGGIGYMPYSGNLSKFFKPSLGGTMSLSYFSSNNIAYFFFLFGTDAKLKQDVSVVWQAGDSVKFYSFGLAAGYSLLNHVKWRITPFIGLPLLETKPRKPTVKEYPELKQYKTGLKLTPEIGVNITYKFIKPQSYYNFNGTSGCFALNMRINYLPFAVNQKKLPYHGGNWYLTIGVCLELFNAYSTSLP
jgi:hypothetical protein